MYSPRYNVPPVKFSCAIITVPDHALLGNVISLKPKTIKSSTVGLISHAGIHRSTIHRPKIIRNLTVKYRVSLSTQLFGHNYIFSFLFRMEIFKIPFGFRKPRRSVPSDPSDSYYFPNTIVSHGKNKFFLFSLINSPLTCSEVNSFDLDTVVSFEK